MTHDEQEAYRIECFNRWKAEQAMGNEPASPENKYDYLDISLKANVDFWERNHRRKLNIGTKEVKKPKKPKPKIDLWEDCGKMRACPSLKKGKAPTFPRKESTIKL